MTTFFCRFVRWKCCALIWMNLMDEPASQKQRLGFFLILEIFKNWHSKTDIGYIEKRKYSKRKVNEKKKKERRRKWKRGLMRETRGKITEERTGEEMKGRKQGGGGGIMGHEGLLWILVSCSSRGSCPPISSHLLILLPLLPPHVPPTLRQEHVDDGMCGPFFFFAPCLLFPSQVCMWLSAHIGLTCESACVWGSLCRLRVCMCFSVSASQKRQT